MDWLYRTATITKRSLLQPALQIVHLATALQQTLNVIQETLILMLVLHPALQLLHLATALIQTLNVIQETLMMMLVLQPMRLASRLPRLAPETLPIVLRPLKSVLRVPPLTLCAIRDTRIRCPRQGAEPVAPVPKGNSLLEVL